MSNEGWISIHRKMLTNPLFQAKPFCKGFAWITLLLLTNRKVGYKTAKNGTKIKIQRGECGYSFKALADIFGWSRGKLKRWLETLENDKMTDTKKIGQDCYVIRILNYDTYQNGHQTDTQTDTKTDTQKLRKTDTKKIGSNTDYIYISKSELEKMIQQKIKETDIPSVQKTDTNNNNTIYSNNIISSSSSIEEFLEKISKEDEEDLRNYSKIKKVKYFRPWLRKLIERGDHLEILDKAKLIAQRQKQKENIPPPEKIEIEDEKITRETMKKARAKVLQGLKGEKND